ncbi:MAG: hypothetical protein JO065_03750 [Acidobacteria bacterium]|nr:hypothetical protein [Acidobacteriota bacterium]
MELLLNLVWIAFSCASLTAWALWRRRSSSRSMPGLLRGMLVVTCVLALLFPVISISDDLSQAIGLAEGTRLQDVLKAPDVRAVCASSTPVPDDASPLAAQSSTVTHAFLTDVPTSLYQLLRTPAIEKRPPPSA